jgi:hypothetical protein
LASSADVATVAARFEPLSLEALDEAAALPVRTDRKYVVGLAVLERLTAGLCSDYRALEIDGRRVFHYDTVYFDTAALLTYHQHLRGRRKRFKLRSRHYTDTGVCAFEVKLLDGRGRTVKRRLACEPEQHGLLGARARAHVDAVLAELYGVTTPGDLAPALRTTFNRLTLVGSGGGERFTVDVGLAFRPVAGGALVIRPGAMVLETKTAAASGAADRMLWRLGARPVESCSKYCVGLALSDERLPSNRFNRVLRRHLTPLPAASASA